MAKIVIIAGPIRSGKSTLVRSLTIGSDCETIHGKYWIPNYPFQNNVQSIYIDDLPLSKIEECLSRYAGHELLMLNPKYQHSYTIEMPTIYISVVVNCYPNKYLTMAESRAKVLFSNNYSAIVPT